MLSGLRCAPRSLLLARAYSTRTSTSKEPFKILFCGSDAFSTASLEALLDAEDLWQSITVLTPREREVGRGKSKTYVPPLKLFALERNLAHHDVPSTGLAFPSPFTAHHPSHLLLTASFGHIIPTTLMTAFEHALNVHPSALPRYRGAAPVQWAIANRDEYTGVSVQNMAPKERGIDSGDVLGQVDCVPIPPKATYTTLLPDLAHLGARLLVNTLRQLREGTLAPKAQENAKATRAPKVSTHTARVDWRLPAAQVEAHHRAWGHQAALWTELAEAGPAPTDAKAKPSPSSVQLTAIALPSDGPVLDTPDEPGMAVLDRRTKRVLVRTADGWVEVTRVKAAGKKEMPAAEWWNGLPKGVRERGWIAFE